VNSNSIFGQIEKQKGFFLSYHVVYKCDDMIGGPKFIQFLSINNINNAVKYINILNCDFSLNTVNQLFNGKKIYNNYGLYLNCLYKSSDSLKHVINEHYNKNLNEDSLIANRTIYNKKVILINRNKQKYKFVSEIELHFIVFYGELTYTNYQAFDNSYYFSVFKWNYDTINNAFLYEEKGTNEIVGLLLNIE
jgi:hypothetical protein